LKEIEAFSPKFHVFTILSSFSHNRGYIVKEDISRHQYFLKNSYMLLPHVEVSLINGAGGECWVGQDKICFSQIYTHIAFGGIQYYWLYS